MQVSQTQSPLDLGPEVSNLGFFDRGPPVCETFPFQKDAMAFADWCNAAGPEKVAMLQRICKPINFRSFADRWVFMQQQMQLLMTEGQDGCGGGVGAREVAGTAAAASTAAGSEGRQNQGMEQQGVLQKADELQAPQAPHNHEPPQRQAAERARGSGDGGLGQQGEQGQDNASWIRIFTEEYEGQHGYTRRFLAASYKVCEYTFVTPC
jgi:hypothetical protein